MTTFYLVKRYKPSEGVTYISWTKKKLEQDITDGYDFSILSISRGSQGITFRITVWMQGGGFAEFMAETLEDALKWDAFFRTLVQPDYFYGTCACPHCGDVLQLNPYDYGVKYCGRAEGHSYFIRRIGSTICVED